VRHATRWTGIPKLVSPLAGASIKQREDGGQRRETHAD
jgi:hypothetical protein